MYLASTFKKELKFIKIKRVIFLDYIQAIIELCITQLLLSYVITTNYPKIPGSWDYYNTGLFLTLFTHPLWVPTYHVVLILSTCFCGSTGTTQTQSLAYNLIEQQSLAYSSAQLFNTVSSPTQL